MLASPADHGPRWLAHLWCPSFLWVGRVPSSAWHRWAEGASCWRVLQCAPCTVAGLEGSEDALLCGWCHQSGLCSGLAARTGTVLDIGVPPQSLRHSSGGHLGGRSVVGRPENSSPIPLRLLGAAWVSEAVPSSAQSGESGEPGNWDCLTLDAGLAVTLGQ